MTVLTTFQRAALLIALLSTEVHSGSSKKGGKKSSWCTCSPLVYRWELNFDGTCSIPDNDGISSFSTCRVEDGTPVKVDKLVFAEYDNDLGLVNWQELPGEWLNGDIMEVESITNKDPNVVTSFAAFELEAINAEGDDILFQWIVDYTNACGVDPYTNVTNIGWLEWDIVDGPDPSLCDPCGDASDYTSSSGKGKGATVKCSKKTVKSKSGKSRRGLKSRSAHQRNHVF